MIQTTVQSRTTDIVPEPRASRGARSLESFGLLAELVMIVGIVEWPRDLYN